MMVPVFHALTRRRFLISGTSFLALAGVRPLWAATKPPGKLRYCAITPEADDLVPQKGKSDMAWVAAENPKTLSIPAWGDDYFAGFRTLLTIVDEDGGNIRRLWVPGLLHTGSFSGDRLYVVTRGRSPAFYAVDMKTLEIVASAKPEEGWFFGGHVIPWREPGQLAVTVNSQKAGAYDRVDVYEAAGLRKVHSIPSQGFQAHELALSPDKKLLYVGHYGSYYASGPYQPFYDEYARKLRMPDGDLNYYPGSVSVIDLVDGKLLSKVSDTRNGAQGHLAPSSRKQVFLTRLPPLLASREDVMQSPVFAEGTENKICAPELYDATRFISSGTTVMTDETTQQFMLANTIEQKMTYGSFDNPGDLSGAHMAPAYGKPCGLAFHPDGEHYIASCTQGFAVMKRGTHEGVEARSIAVRLDWHSHMCAG